MWHVPWFQFTRRAKTQRNNRRWKCLDFGLDWVDGVSNQIVSNGDCDHMCLGSRWEHSLNASLLYVRFYDYYTRVYDFDFHRDAIVFLHRTTHVYYFFGYDRYMRHINDHYNRYLLLYTLVKIVNTNTTNASRWQWRRTFIIIITTKNTKTYLI
jgi:hypothetical protein